MQYTHLRGFFLRVAEDVSSKKLLISKKLGAQSTSKFSSLVVENLMLLEGIRATSPKFASRYWKFPETCIDSMSFYMVSQQSLVPSDICTPGHLTGKLWLLIVPFQMELETKICW